MRNLPCLYSPILDVPEPAYCVPTAVSALTREPVSKIHGILINKYGLKAPIIGVYVRTAICLMNDLGYDYPDWSGASQHRVRKHLRVKEFLVTRGMAGTYLLFVNGHAIAVQNGYFLDTTTNGPIRINGGHYANYSYRRWLVESWYLFEHKYKYPWHN